MTTFNERINKRLEKIVGDFIIKYEEKEKQLQEFIANDKYLEVLDNILKNNTNITSEDVYKNDDDNDIDKLFRFIYRSCGNMIGECEEFVIRYKDKYISFYEMHGQGCFRNINIVDSHEGSFIELEDIIIYNKFETLPYKYEAFNLVNRAINTLEVALGEQDEIDFEKLKEYVKAIMLHSGI